VSVRTC